MKSLGITDKEKYGDSYGSSPSSLTDKKSGSAKSFPTVTLTGPQITALGLDDSTLGDTGTLTLKYAVKHLEAGSKYSSTLDSGSRPTEMTLAFTDGHAAEDEDEDDEDDEDDENDEKGEDETAPSASEPDDTDDTGEDAAPSGDDDGANEDDEGADDTKPAAKKDTVSPSEAGLDD